MTARHDPHANHLAWLPGNPITPGCPLACLRFLLSGHAYRPLEDNLPRILARPATVGDVADLHRQRRLRAIPALGPRRIGEIELMLVVYGFCVARQDPRNP